MQKQRVVILQDSNEGILDIVKAISELNDFTIEGTSCDGEEGIELIKKVNPTCIIIGIVLKNLDGFAVMERLRDYGYKGKIVVVSSFTSVGAVNRAMASNVSFYLAKPFKPELLISRLKELDMESDASYLEKSPKRNNQLEERISKIFISVGIPPHIKGYQYLREGVKMAVNEPTIINNITKQLYPKIGEKYSTTASKVERAIRHAIEVAWNRGRIEAINSMLGIRAYVGSE